MLNKRDRMIGGWLLRHGSGLGTPTNAILWDTRFKSSTGSSGCMDSRIASLAHAVRTSTALSRARWTARVFTFVPVFVLVFVSRLSPKFIVRGGGRGGGWLAADMLPGFSMSYTPLPVSRVPGRLFRSQSD